MSGVERQNKGRIYKGQYLCSVDSVQDEREQTEYDEERLNGRSKWL